MLNFVVWNDSYSVKVRRLDEHHKRILRLVNELYGKFYDGVQPGDLRQALSQLVAYTQTHFEYEQRLMHLAGYKDIEAHTAKHARMTAKTADLYARFDKDTESLSREVFDFLKEWWSGHIAAEDSKYAPIVSSLDWRLLG